MREGDPPCVSVVELHGDEVPIILEAQQACGRRGRLREARGAASSPGSGGARVGAHPQRGGPPEPRSPEGAQALPRQPDVS